MVNIYSRLDLNDPYYQDYQDFDEDVTESQWNNFNADALPDEVMEEAEYYAKESPNLKNQVADDIENITTQVFIHFCSIADRIERSSVEAAVMPASHVPSSPSPSKSPSDDDKFSDSHSFSVYQKDSNFCDEYELEQPTHTQNVINNIFTTLGHLFLGWQKSDPQKDPRTPEEMEKGLKVDYITWQIVLKKHYSDYFQGKMYSIFRQAEELLKARQEDENIADLQRFTFYASLIIAGIGKVVNQKAVMILGLVASAITFIFMITHYGTASFRQSQLESGLQSSVDKACDEAGKHRLNSQPSVING